MTRDAGGVNGLDVVATPAVNVEFYRDVRPLLQRSCVPCHRAAAPAAGLVLYHLALYGGLPGDYKRLADDRDAQWGYPPVIANGTWRQTNASRYVRMFRSRRSLLVWKLFGARLDGWTNADHPSETVPGDPSTLPAGADPSAADLDFTGTVMPPPGSSVPPLTEEEKMRIARWIDLGCPINSGAESGDGAYGWFLDDQRPTLTVSLPRPGESAEPVTALRFGVADAYSGVALATLSVKADFPVAGRPQGAELADLAAAVDDGVYAIDLGAALPPSAGRHLWVEVADIQGNVTRVARTFSTLGALFADGFESGDVAAWSVAVSCPDPGLGLARRRELRMY